ncbi:amidohydrolase 2 [Trichoderma austrokoningii]
MASLFVTLEEHFLSIRPDWLEKLTDITPNGVLSNSFRITSLIPGIAAAANDELHNAIQVQPRFKGFVTLPMKHGKAAAAKLGRFVKVLGMVVAHIDNVFSKAQELDHCDIALSMSRMYAVGIFWKYPNLKVLVGHMGEILPYITLDRIDEKVGQIWQKTELSFKQVWAKNIWVTTSGTTNVDTTMYNVDYPYSNTEQGVSFMRELREIGLVTEEEYEKIAFKNAETLLKFGV